MNNHTNRELSPTIQSWIRDWVVKTQGKCDHFSTVPLAGDGSARLFFRIQCDSLSLVVLVDPQWKWSVDYPAHQAFLKSHQIPVPEFYAVSEKLGALIMEDLGDQLLQSPILSQPNRRCDYLDSAVKLLAKFHSLKPPTDLPGSQRVFDAQKYRQELAYTESHLLEQLLGFQPLTKATTSQWYSFCQKIAGIQPLVLCHRDYHTRNILFKDNALYLIDFQDARMGCPHYDLASLLYDPYVSVEDPDKVLLVNSYKKALDEELAKKVDWQVFDEQLKWVAFQRMIKAAGSFASFYTKRGKQTHLKYLVPALQNALVLRPSEWQEAFGIEQWLAKIKEQPWDP